MTANIVATRFTDCLTGANGDRYVRGGVCRSGHITSRLPLGNPTLDAQSSGPITAEADGSSPLRPTFGLNSTGTRLVRAGPASLRVTRVDISPDPSVNRSQREPTGDEKDDKSHEYHDGRGRRPNAHAARIGAVIRVRSACSDVDEQTQQGERDFHHDEPDDSQHREAETESRIRPGQGEQKHGDDGGRQQHPSQELARERSDRDRHDQNNQAGKGPATETDPQIDLLLPPAGVGMAHLGLETVLGPRASNPVGQANGLMRIGLA